jgi:uncharacterized protein (DUF4415 family)
MVMTMSKLQLSTRSEMAHAVLFPFEGLDPAREVSYSLEELALLEDRTDWEKARRNLTDDEINVLIKDDEDWKYDLDTDWSKAVFVPAKNKKPISIRLDEDILLFFKLQGKGYQTAINQILRERMNEMMGKDVS